MPKVYKLSIESLKGIIAEEKKRISEDTAPKQVREVPKKPDKEVEADEYADTLEDPVNWLKAAKVKEGRLLKALKKLREGMRRKRRKINEAKKSRK